MGVAQGLDDDGKIMGMDSGMDGNGVIFNIYYRYIIDIYDLREWGNDL